MKPPAAKGSDELDGYTPDKTKARVPVGMVVLVCEYASPARVAVVSISISFRWLASIAKTSNTPPNAELLSVVEGLEEGPRVSEPVSASFEKALMPPSFTSSRPVRDAPLRVKLPTAAYGLPLT